MGRGERFADRETAGGVVEDNEIGESTPYIYPCSVMPSANAYQFKSPFSGP